MVEDGCARVAQCHETDPLDSRGRSAAGPESVVVVGAGDAPEEWLPIRPDGSYEEHGIDRVHAGATALDTGRRELRLDDGRTLPYGAILLATGATPRSLDAAQVPGADRPLSTRCGSGAGGGRGLEGRDPLRPLVR